MTASLSGLRCLTNEPLSHYTFTKTGGPADLLVFPASVDQVRQALAYATAQQLPVTVIGNASNLIVRDGGIAGLVMILTDMTNITSTATTVTAAAGARLIDTTEAAYQAGLSGLEFAAGIPGSVGGGVFMNAGAYGGEVKDVLQSATVMTPAGEVQTYSAQDLAFSYRHSLVQDTGDVILAATFALTPGDKPAIRAEMDHLNALRAAKQPLEYPSCGRYLSGPRLLRRALDSTGGPAGQANRGAQISEKHAGFIVNRGGATATDYLAVIHLVQTTVFAKFGVHLEPEVRIIGHTHSVDE